MIGHYTREDPEDTNGNTNGGTGSVPGTGIIPQEHNALKDELLMMDNLYEKL